MLELDSKEVEAKVNIAYYLNRSSVVSLRATFPILGRRSNV